MSAEASGATPEAKGCDVCREAISGVMQDDKFVVDKKVETAFLRKFSYFQAIFKTCKACGATWLSVYYEDLTNTDPMKEFGDRYGYKRIVTDEEIAHIRKKIGMGALDVDDFAPGR